jgi:hypothetical protein
MTVVNLGPAFTVNTQTAGIQDAPQAIGLTGGGYVVTWTDSSGTLGDNSGTSIKAQIFDANDNKIGSEFLVNTNTTGNQGTIPNATGVGSSTIARLSNGGFVITWQDASMTLGDASGTSVKGQVFDALGNKVGTEFLANTNTAGDQFFPQVTGLSGGGFVISWGDNGGTLGDASGTSVKAQVFDNAGNKVGTEFLVNTNTTSNQGAEHIASLSNGNFVVTWSDASGTLGDASGLSIKGQIFDPAGNKVGAEFLLNTTTAGDQSFPVVAGQSGGGFAVAWQASSGLQITGQLFDNSGNKIGTEFLVGTALTQRGLSLTDIASTGVGGFVVSWLNQGGSNDLRSKAAIQTFDASGKMIDGAILLSDSHGTTINPAVADLTDGTFVATSRSFDFSIADIDAQHFKILNSAPVAQNGSASLNEAGFISGKVAATDSDNDPLLYSLVAPASHGTVVFNADGTFSYTPTGGYTGADGFAFKANDGALDSNVAGESLTINPVSFPANGGNVDEWIFSGGAWAASAQPGSHPAGSHVVAVADFTNDHTSDILWQNVSTGALDLWKISNGGWAGSFNFDPHPGSGWQVAGAGDFDRNGSSDVFWFNPGTGQTDVWLMSNGQWSSSVNPGNHPTGYQVAGIGDFNGDGTSDVLWFNPTTGKVDEWTMAAGHWAGSTDLGAHPGSGWQIAGIGDFNKDGTSDVFWFNPGSGETDIWLLANGHWSASVSPGNHPTGYQVAGVGDFNHDGNSDVLFMNTSTGQIDEWVLVNGHWTASVDLGAHPGGGWAVAGIGDFTGSGTSGVLWHQFV